jgi:hypothetical protein
MPYKYESMQIYRQLHLHSETVNVFDGSNKYSIKPLQLFAYIHLEYPITTVYVQLIYGTTMNIQ